MEIPENRYATTENAISIAFPFAFEDTGEHELKGVSDRGRPYRVVNS